MRFAWLREASPEARRALLAATSGWMLDAMDVMLYAFALTAIRAEFGLDGAQAGLLASVTLIASAVGGIGAGILADRFGRARILVLSILVAPSPSWRSGVRSSVSAWERSGRRARSSSPRPGLPRTGARRSA